MLNEYCGKRQGASSAPARSEAFRPGKAVAKMGWFLLTVMSFAGFAYFFRHPLTFVTRLSGYVTDAFHRAMAGDFMGGGDFGRGNGCGVSDFVCVEAKEKW